MAAEPAHAGGGPAGAGVRLALPPRRDEDLELRVGWLLRSAVAVEDPFEGHVDRVVDPTELVDVVEALAEFDPLVEVLEGLAEAEGDHRPFHVAVLLVPAVLDEFDHARAGNPGALGEASAGVEDVGDLDQVLAAGLEGAGDDLEGAVVLLLSLEVADSAVVEVEDDVELALEVERTQVALDEGRLEPLRLGLL